MSSAPAAPSVSLLARRFANDATKLALAGLAVALAFEWRQAIGQWLEVRYPLARASPEGRMRFVCSLTAMAAATTALVTTYVLPASRPHALAALKVSGLARA